ncbi:MAG TPA: peptidase, partial [Actinobacteria bacterium]|nr:peptidase [Actinomycetota bacterium]
DYAGSSGHGRAYRERLTGRWGVADVDDCVRAALHVAGQGRADRDRMAIRGGSAGGYAALCAVVFHDVFAAGASYFGVADLEGLLLDTHKFEARYGDGLVGKLPEAVATMRERSPVHFADRIRCPVILFQGLDDPVVPPAQAEIMVEAMRRNGVPFAYLAFEGEAHGFRRAESMRRSLEAELSFYGQVFGFEPAGNIEPVTIERPDEG